MGAFNCKERQKTECDTTDGPSGSYQYSGEKFMKMADYGEYTAPVPICNISELEDDKMVSYNYDEQTPVLVIKKGDKIYALGNKCTHYGAPLNTGVLGNGVVRCPWHGACFNIETGDIEDFPGLDSLPCYKVNVENDGNVTIQAKQKDAGKTKHLKDMSKFDPNNTSVFVIVGGGPAGAVCAETLRQEGFTGRIIMLCQEGRLPYDRIKLTKGMDHITKLVFREDDFYKEHDIELWLSVEATGLDVANKLVHCSNNTKIKYDKIFIATGGTAKKPYEVIGTSFKNVYTIRKYDDIRRLKDYIAKIKDLHVVVYGTSFIALESAAYFAKKSKYVTLVGRSHALLENSLGPNVGEKVRKLFEENNIKIALNLEIKECNPDCNGLVESVTLSNGKKIECNLVIIGTGISLNTEFLKNSGITINANGSITTDEYLMSEAPDVYIGGDIAHAPIIAVDVEKATIGHIQLAQYHGRIAAINMVKNNIKPLKTVPFFFTLLLGKGIRFAGHGKYDEEIADGDPAELKFVHYYLNKGVVVAVATCGRDPIAAQFAELLHQGKRIYRDELKYKEDKSAWVEKLKE